MTGCDPAVGVEERNVVVHEIEMTVPKTEIFEESMLTGLTWSGPC